MTEKTITRADLAEYLHQKIGHPKSECGHYVDTVLEAMSLGLERDGQSKVPHFGTFSVHQKKARIGRNPKTKEEAVISARNVVSFTISNKLKKRLNP